MLLHNIFLFIEVAYKQLWSTVIAKNIEIEDMNKPRKGLCETDIEAILEFDWDESSDEVCEDDEEEFLQKGLNEILEKGEEIEINLLEDITTEERVEEYPESSERHAVEKVDLSTLRWRKNPFGKIL